MKRNLSQITNSLYDLLVIGGGIYGAFTAWDAALRGLSVALVERQDFGGATSANSQKIIHGGFRYLQHGDFKRMRESIRERTNLMRIAPHLIHPLPVLIPTYGHGMRGKELLKLALNIYDFIGFNRNSLSDPEKKIPCGKSFSRNEALRLLPLLPQEGLTGAGVFYDASVYNSERLVISLLKSAEKKGAQCANYVKVIGFIQEKDAVAGVECKDLLGGECFPVRARMVVNTSGPWLYHVLSLLDHYRQVQFPLIKSFNVITRPLFEKYAVGIYGKNPYQDKDNLLNKGTRLFFVTPWRDHSVVGTALSPFNGNPDDLQVTTEEIQKFLDDFNEACPDAKLKMEDISFLHQGFLPNSIMDHQSRSGEVRIQKKYHIIDHRVDGIKGLISVMGVKYTTARDVAKKVVDHVFECWGEKPPKSLSAFTRIEGGDIEKFEDFLTGEIKKRSFGLDTSLISSLVFNYGSIYHKVLSLLGGETMGHDGLLKAQVLYSVREEMAQKLSDVVLRRTELGSAGKPTDHVLKVCAETMGQELKWNFEKIETELQEMKVFFKRFIK
ncbi:MAG: glycerol-3-phosphate dehydrogenase/oxidase [Chlamydiae bacterium]|nr:glycerol-3-phosphate dehydrogenase/oxidase [Chlamydiota bacterium]MBI3276601.1 glycerol-3-phosphate dehydrogenase/oxidase [Chlamydiota bacterium]